MERAMLIRRGNELFNKRDYKNALKIFIAVDYKEGIGRIASVMEHEQKDMPSALRLYKRAGMTANVEKIAYDMAQTVRLLIKEDKQLEASQKGENYDSGSKISGQSPSMLPHEAVIRAKEKLGIKDDRIARYHSQNISPWRPEVISKEDLDKFKKK